MNAEQRRAASRRNRKTCAYCGVPSSTRDHIPPRGIFGDILKRAPGTQLITVPACRACNEGSTEDDAYFRDAVFMASQQDGEPPEFDDVRAPIRRAAQKAGKKYTTPMQEIFRNARPAWGVASEGGVLEKGMQFVVNWTRIKKVVERIARGLYWSHTKERVPPGYIVHVIGDKEAGETQSNDLFERYEELAQAALGNYKRHVHLAAFSYAMTLDTEDPKAACFALLFYRHQMFLALIARQPTGASGPATTRIVLA